jgi:hypothetical protein
MHVIVSSSRSKRKSNSNYRKLREAVYKKIRGSLSFRQFNKDVQQGQQLD